MKTIFTKQCKKVLLLFILLLISSCHLFEQDKKSDSQQIKKCLVVVKDQSASVSESAEDIEKQKLWIKKYLNEHFSPESDIIVLMVNSSSSSPVNHKEILWKNTQSEKTDQYKSETDQMLEENKQEMNNLLQFKRNQKRLLELVFNPEDSQKSNQTQIIELLPHFERISKSYSSLDILLLTDAFQESQIRDFSQMSPVSKAQAEQFAVGDYKKVLKAFGLPNNVLKKTQSIQVLVPPKTNSELLVNIPYYYEAFFFRFGYKKPIKWDSI